MMAIYPCFYFRCNQGKNGIISTCGPSTSENEILSAVTTYCVALGSSLGLNIYMSLPSIRLVFFGNTEDEVVV
jgi:hypothetical protein